MRAPVRSTNVTQPGCGTAARLESMARAIAVLTYQTPQSPPTTK
jgi:hypothetical protein